mmetsp:Transcript_36250/g.73700  ORF Transcript_36250/g.73700 Transcript_36250/m.73700 type:complete len:128 (-) Transcript_36250:146-529(-)
MVVVVVRRCCLCYAGERIVGRYGPYLECHTLVTGTSLATLDNHENGVSVVGLPPPPPAVPIGNDGGATTIAESPSSLRGRLATTSAGVAANNTIRDHRVRLWDITLPTLSCIVSGGIIGDLSSYSIE